jgi:hypothetical protein
MFLQKIERKQATLIQSARPLNSIVFNSNSTASARNPRNRGNPNTMAAAMAQRLITTF